MMKVVINDGGRAAAGYKGKTGDCVARAISIAAHRPYAEVYDTLAHIQATMPKTKRRKKAGVRSASHGIIHGDLFRDNVLWNADHIVAILDFEQASGGTLRQKIALQQGIPIERAKEIVRLIKDSKVRVQASIQEDQVRVAGKNRDDLQKIIALIKEKDLGIALQFTNYRSA